MELSVHFEICILEFLESATCVFVKCGRSCLLCDLDVRLRHEQRNANIETRYNSKHLFASKAIERNI